MEKSATLLRTFRLHSIVAVAALVLEFLLGMYTALFVKFPEDLPNGNAWGWAMSNSLVTVAHIALGSLLLVAALSALGFGMAARSRAAIASAGLGLFSVGLAYMSGSVFLANMEGNAYSFAMAVGFIGAILAYGIGFHLTRARENA